ncbi:MAG: hypothetical protein RI897_3626 [Verrucomicrobiota bacterium]
MAGLGAGMGLFMCGLFMRLQGGLLRSTRLTAGREETGEGRGCVGMSVESRAAGAAHPSPELGGVVCARVREWVQGVWL